MSWVRSSFWLGDYSCIWNYICYNICRSLRIEYGFKPTVESISATVGLWLLVLSMLLKSFVVCVGSSITKEVVMNSIKNIKKWFGSVVSYIAVPVVETVWAVLTSYVAGICLLASIRIPSRKIISGLILRPACAQYDGSAPRHSACVKSLNREASASITGDTAVGNEEATMTVCVGPSSQNATIKIC